jgi:[ribosomal protein S5]-alanine N-acetyltransferase
MMINILETNRLILRQFELTDAQAMFDLNVDEEVIKYTGDVAFESIEKAKEFLKSYSHYQQYGYGRWAVILKANGDFAGWCGLKYAPGKDEVDLGFRFFRKHWNNGYATEAAKACIDYGFNKLSLAKIVGRVMNSNLASIRVLEKTGMKLEKEIDPIATGFYGEPARLYAISKTK